MNKLIKYFIELMYFAYWWAKIKINTLNDVRMLLACKDFINAFFFKITKTVHLMAII